MRLTEDPNAPPLNHKDCLRQAASKLDNLRQHPEEIFINTEEIKAALRESDDPQYILQKLSGIDGIKEYFRRKEASSRLEEMMLVSRIKGPLSEFPPDINSNVYSNIINFAVDHCPDILQMLLDIIVQRGKPVQEKDVLRVSFIFSSLAHGTSRVNNAVTKVKSLVLQSQGLTVNGLDKLALLGISETSRSTLNSTDLLAEVSDSILKESCKTMSSQSTVDNLDFQTHHMCLEYKQMERQDTSHLSTGNTWTGVNSLDKT